MQGGRRGPRCPPRKASSLPRGGRADPGTYQAACLPGCLELLPLRLGLPATQQGFSKEALETPHSRLLICLSIKEMAPKSRARCCLAFAPTGAALQKPIRREAKAAWPGLRGEQTVPRPTPECRSLLLASGTAPRARTGLRLELNTNPRNARAGPDRTLVWERMPDPDVIWI